MNSVQPAAQPSPWNVPNALTVLRVVAVPFFVYFLLADGGQLGADRIIAAVIFLAAIITDQIDGAWARKYNLITDFGKIADPIADKLLIGAALICLSILGELWWWVTALILLREIGITVWRITIVKNKVVPASRGGKIKTVLQTVALLLYLFPFALWWGSVGHWAAVIAMTLAFAATLITGVDYLVRAYTKK